MLGASQQKSGNTMNQGLIYYFVGYVGLIK